MTISLSTRANIIQPPSFNGTLQAFGLLNKPSKVPSPVATEGTIDIKIMRSKAICTLKKDHFEKVNLTFLSGKVLETNKDWVIFKPDEHHSGIETFNHPTHGKVYYLALETNERILLAHRGVIFFTDNNKAHSIHPRDAFPYYNSSQTKISKLQQVKSELIAAIHREHKAANLQKLETYQGPEFAATFVFRTDATRSKEIKSDCRKRQATDKNQQSNTSKLKRIHVSGSNISKIPQRTAGDSVKSVSTPQATDSVSTAVPDPLKHSMPKASKGIHTFSQSQSQSQPQVTDPLDDVVKQLALSTQKNSSTSLPIAGGLLKPVQDVQPATQMTNQVTIPAITQNKPSAISTVVGIEKNQAVNNDQAHQIKDAGQAKKEISQLELNAAHIFGSSWCSEVQLKKCLDIIDGIRQEISTLEKEFKTISGQIELMHGQINPFAEPVLNLNKEGKKNFSKKLSDLTHQRVKIHKTIQEKLKILAEKHEEIQRLSVSTDNFNCQFYAKNEKIFQIEQSQQQ